MFKSIGKWWRKRQRATDMEILWPECCEQALDLDHAKAAFAFHCFQDPAWTMDHNHDELVEAIDSLVPPAHTKLCLEE